MSDIGRGMPLLSGPPPLHLDTNSAEMACRKCNKEFNVIFARSRRCNHCGYAYCHSCSDYQALMPRTGADAITGYDAMAVCAFCIEFLTITAAGRNQLKALPLSKLKKYIAAYNIKIDRAVEKDDLIDAIISARGPNGCLPRANEHHYRLYSVPNKTQGRAPRGLFSRGQNTSADTPPPPPPRPPRTNGAQEFARPDLAPDSYPPTPPRSSRPQAFTSQQQQPQPQQPYHQQQQYAPPPYPPPPNSRPSFPYPQHHPQPQQPQQPQGGYYYAHQHQHQQPQPPPMPPQNSRPGAPPPAQNHSTRPMPHAQPSTSYPTYTPRFPHPQSTPASQPHSHSHQSTPAPPPPPRPRSTAPPPTLAQLLTMDQSEIAGLGIGALKQILFTNHVNAGMILEKGDLVQRVVGLVEDERRERERMRIIEEREAEEMREREEERARERDAEEESAREREREREWEAERVASGEAARDEEMRAGDGSDAGVRPESPAARTSTDGNSEPTPAPVPAAKVPTPKTQGSASTLERTGLCVICQDEEANIAIVDCGHMAMCRGCSDLIMASSRECPLCRTRIVTEARLLRIFKT